MSDTSLEVFLFTWDLLADDGWCDELGSAECSRVVTEWSFAGRPLDCVSFILGHANRPLR